MIHPIHTFNRPQLFDLNNAINIREQSLYTKMSIKNEKEIKLDSLSLSDTFMNSQPGSIGKIEVVVEEKNMRDLDFKRSFKEVIERSNVLSRDEINLISQLAKKAIEKNEDYFKGTWTSDKETMYHLQTQKKLELIAKTILPESMQPSFLNTSQKYIDQKLEDTVNISKNIYEVIYNRYKDEESGPLKHIANQMKGALSEIKDGHHITQTEQKQYEELYIKLDMSSGNRLKQSYEKVMEGYSKIQKQQHKGHWSHSSESRTDEIVNLLREDWNKFVSAVSTLSEYEVFSKTSSIFNEKI